MRIAFNHFLTFVIKYCKIISLFLLKLLGRKRFVNSVKVFSAGIKSTNPMQKYQHIIESNACILEIFVFMFLVCKAADKGRPINALISFGICSPLKDHYFVRPLDWLCLRTKQPNESQYQSTHQYLLHMPPILYFG